MSRIPKGAQAVGVIKIETTGMRAAIYVTRTGMWYARYADGGQDIGQDGLRGKSAADVAHMSIFLGLPFDGAGARLGPVPGKCLYEVCQAVASATGSDVSLCGTLVDCRRFVPL